MNQTTSHHAVFDFSALGNSASMLEWYHPNPFDKLIQDITSQLEGCEPHLSIETFSVTKDPVWITSLTPESNEGSDDFQSKVGVAFEFQAQLLTKHETLKSIIGTYTWVARNILEPGDIRDKAWLDMSGELDAFGTDGLLSTRLTDF
ncbi:MAG: hypothetical protein AAGJ37_14580 [Pseudomonadota bacterium]